MVVQVQFLLLFFEGIITFISPCLLPMLPVYISYFAAGGADKRRTVVNSLGFVGGFTAIFIILGAFSGAVGGLLQRYGTIVNIVTGSVVILLGLNFLGVVNIGFLNRLGVRSSGGRSGKSGELRFFSSFIFGFTFSLSWTPCVGAFLGSALMMASQQGGVVTGILMLLIYSLGLGIPFVVSAVLIDSLKGAFDFIKRNYKIINMISGIFLILIGALMATGFLGRLMYMLSS